MPLSGSKRQAFIVAGYQPTGGGRMLHSIGEILHAQLGFTVTVVTLGNELTSAQEPPARSRFPRVPIEDLIPMIRREDVLIMSPAASHYWLGYSAACRKLMYVQGFNTFPIMDCFFDRYVCVSEFCRSILKTTYAIDAPVIPAFVTGTEHTPRPGWHDRPSKLILVHSKGDMRLKALMLETIERKVRCAFPDAVFEDLLKHGPIPHSDLLRRLACARYLLTLSVAEGFGLVPLEAMGLGVTVTGFDGFGGRQYMRFGENCACVPFPEVGAIGDGLVRLLGDSDRAEQLGRKGVETAAHFRRDAFEARWLALLREFLDA